MLNIRIMWMEAGVQKHEMAGAMAACSVLATMVGLWSGPTLGSVVASHTNFAWTCTIIGLVCAAIYVPVTIFLTKYDYPPSLGPWGPKLTPDLMTKSLKDALGGAAFVPANKEPDVKCMACGYKLHSLRISTTQLKRKKANR